MVARAWRTSPTGAAMALDRTPAVAVAALLLVAIAYWLWLGLEQRSVNTDDGISVLAAQGILKHGYPRMPTGEVYLRAYIPHYLLAASIWLLGQGHLAVMLPSLLLGLGSLWLTYRLARDVLGMPWAGVAAVALLLALQMQAFYATSPRMYMALQLWATLALYSGWRGYVQGEVKYQWATVLAVAAAMLSHQEGAALLVAVPVAVLGALWARRQPLPRVHRLPLLAGLALNGVIALYLLWGLSIMGHLSVATPLSNAESDAGLNLKPARWLRHLLQLERALPLGLAAVLALAVVEVLPGPWRQGRRPDLRREGPALGLMYLSLAVLACAVMVMAGTIRLLPGGRIWFFLLPAYAVLACLGLRALAHAVVAAVRGLGTGRPALQQTLALLPAGCFVVGGAVALLTSGPGVAALAQAYGLPCRGASGCERDIRAHYASLVRQVEEEDLVISTNPAVTHFYLGRVDGLLREKVAGLDGRPYTKTYESDSHFPVPIVDDTAELEALRQGHRRVWVIVDGKLEPDATTDLRDLLQREYEVVQRNGPIATYVGCFQAPCAPVRSAGVGSGQPSDASSQGH